MRDAEEFNRHLVDECLDFGPEWYDGRAVDLIRARDAEVRAATLAGFTEERDTHHRPTRVPCDCEHPMHARLLGDDSPPTHVTAVPVRVRRYVTPWEPEP